MTSSSKMFPIDDSLELSPYALPPMKKRVSKRMDLSSADTPSSIMVKLSFDSGLGSCDLSSADEDTLRPVESVENVFTDDGPTPRTSLDLSSTNENNPDKTVGLQISRLGFKTRKHAQIRTDMKKNKLIMSPSSPTVQKTSIRSMQSLMSPSPIAQQKYITSVNSMTSPTLNAVIKTGINSTRLSMSPSPVSLKKIVRKSALKMSPSPNVVRKDRRNIRPIFSRSPVAHRFNLDESCDDDIDSSRQLSERKHVRKSHLKISPSPNVVRKDKRNIRPIFSRSPIARRFNLDEPSDDDIDSSRQLSERKHVINKQRNDGKSKRSTEVVQVSLDSFAEPEINENEAVPCDVIDSNDVILSEKISVEETSSYYAALSSTDDVSSTELTGDFSRPLCLPLCSTKLSDLNAISPTTAMKVINGEYSHVIDQFLIIDCRYPYEYEGGHIKDARNFSHTSECEEMFEKTTLSQFSSQLNNNKRTVIIVHCEFSQMRGPAMARHLRNTDRTSNGTSYPALHYPEIYVIEGGYKAFHTGHKEQCTPQEYVPMDHPSYSTELAFHRSKTTKDKKVSHRRVTRAPSTKLTLGSPLF